MVFTKDLASQSNPTSGVHILIFWSYWLIWRCS